MRDNSTLAGGDGNNSALTGNAEIAFIVADCLVLVLTFVVGIVANLFVAYAVWHQKSLQTSNNALLVNLAVVDFMRCSTDCPLLLIVVVSGRRSPDLGPVFCDAQIALFSLSCCVQLLTLASISAERYQAIANPFKSAKRRRRVMVWIPLTWIVPMFISIFCVLYTKDSPVYVYCRGLHLDELQTYDTFGLYILFPVWCICLVAILGFYSQIFILVKSHSRKIFDKGVSLPSKKKEDESKKGKIHSKEAKNNIGTEAIIAHETENVPETVDANGGEQKLPEGQVNLNMTAVNESQLTSDCKTLENGRKTANRQLNQPISQIGTFVSELHQDQSDHHFVSEMPTDQPEHQPTLPSLTFVSELPPDQPEHQATFQSLTFVSELPPNQPENQSMQQIGPLVLKLHQDQCDQQRSLEINPESTHVTFASELSHNPPDLINLESMEDPNVPKVADVTPVPAEQNADSMGAVCMMPSFANKDRGNKKKEGKLAKRSGYIILTFLIFWMPLMGTVLVNILMERHRNPMVQIIQELEILAVSVASMTSLTNPIIYAAVNPQFRNEFYNLKIRCKNFFATT